MWLVVKHSNGTVIVCQAVHIPDILNPGETMELVRTGKEPQNLVNTLVSENIFPDVRFVQAYLNGSKGVGRRSRRIICNDTGEVYPSIRQASIAHNIASSNLSNHLRYPDIYKTVGGKTFKYYGEGV